MKQKILLITLATVFAVQSLTGMSLAGTPNKPKLVVLSELDSDSLDTFYNAIALRNPSIDAITRPEAVLDADIIVLLMEDWTDIELYIEGELPPYFENIQNLPPNATLARVVLPRKEDGTLVHFIFFSRSGQNHKSLVGYAEDVTAVLHKESGVKNDALRSKHRKSEAGAD